MANVAADQLLRTLRGFISSAARWTAFCLATRGALEFFEIQQQESGAAVLFARHAMDPLTPLCVRFCSPSSSLLFASIHHRRFLRLLAAPPILSLRTHLRSSDVAHSAARRSAVRSRNANDSSSLQRCLSRCSILTLSSPDCSVLCAAVLRRSMCRECA